MKTKGFTLMEMLIAMSLMGLILNIGGKLYQHLQGNVLRAQEQQQTMMAQLISQRILQQDLRESTEVLSVTDSSLCLIKHPFDPPVCYVWRDSLLFRQREGGSDTLPGVVVRRFLVEDSSE